MKLKAKQLTVKKLSEAPGLDQLEAYARAAEFGAGGKVVGAGFREARRFGNYRASAK